MPGVPTILLATPLFLGPTELAVLAVLVILLFGAKKLPELAKSTGEALKEFKKATREVMAEDDEPTSTNASTNPPRRMEMADSASQDTVSSGEQQQG